MVSTTRVARSSNRVAGEAVRMRIRHPSVRRLQAHRPGTSAARRIVRWLFGLSLSGRAATCGCVILDELWVGLAYP